MHRRVLLDVSLPLATSLKNRRRSESRYRLQENKTGDSTEAFCFWNRLEQTRSRMDGREGLSCTRSCGSVILSRLECLSLILNIRSQCLIGFLVEFKRRKIEVDLLENKHKENVKSPFYVGYPACCEIFDYYVHLYTDFMW
ncbi:hypothetical protein KQX54_021723 [Cotesia glomerata]|uniref:Uncharacterized protein n=1 Tax=Cotesia glomerata TaxID=32391 RepID=A0AAV7J9R0_COTGL|nr:hypothetical protein KQX54_021723 [Cotesia glomerata]